MYAGEFLLQKPPRCAFFLQAPRPFPAPPPHWGFMQVTQRGHEPLLKPHQHPRNFILCRAGPTCWVFPVKVAGFVLFFFSPLNLSLPLGIMRVVYRNKRLNLTRRQHSVMVNKHPGFKPPLRGARCVFQEIYLRSPEGVWSSDN